MQQQQVQLAPDQLVSATLEAQEWNLVLAGLGELPFKVAVAVVEKLRNQLLNPAQMQQRPVPLNRPNGDGRQAQQWSPDLDPA